MKPKQLFHKVVHSAGAAMGVNGRVSEGKFQYIARKYDFRGYKRIYLIHIRKTGGTSLNNMFLALAGGDSQVLYRQLATLPSHRLLRNGLIFVGWDVGHINRGNYFYGFSHTPLHELNLPDGTFTITCFRDPVERVLSHYNMLLGYRRTGTNHPCMALEGGWLGENFDHFLQRIPREHLLNQLYMFSRRFDIAEAQANVRRLSLSFFSDGFNGGVMEINRRTGVHLMPIHVRRAESHAPISATQLQSLRDMLAAEYTFLDQVRAHSQSSS